MQLLAAALSKSTDCFCLDLVFRNLGLGFSYDVSTIFPSFFLIGSMFFYISSFCWENISKRMTLCNIYREQWRELVALASMTKSSWTMMT